uniref:N-ribosyldihydronicotinamide:quinone reductase 2 n=1 Tax=Pundamilia nyererei TaxID=303518 RepID=A0A3B4F2Y4_9CICH
MKVLIVYAHESPASFNAAAKDAAVAALTAQGCTVEVSDLYAMKFKAAATTEDITGGLKDAENFCYAKEIKLASEEGRLAEDLKKEQEKLKEADLVIFQFPMYWSSVPAIMKGWMDRVLGFAYAQEKWYSEGIFKDKKAMLSFTTDCPESVYSDTGINGDINVILCQVTFSGFVKRTSLIFYNMLFAAQSEYRVIVGELITILGSRNESCQRPHRTLKSCHLCQ